MPRFLVAAPYTTQPQEAAEIDWSNPVSMGLNGVLNAAALPWTWPTNVTSWTGATQTNFGDSSARIQPAFSGRAFVANSSVGFCQRMNRVLGSQVTVMMVGNWRAAAASSYVAATGNGGNNTVAGFRHATSTQAPAFVVRVANAGAISTAEANATVNTDFATASDVWIGRYDGTSTVKVYRNGVDVTASNANTGASGAFTSNNNQLCFGAIQTSGSSLVPQAGTSGDQVTYLVACWDRALSSAEIAVISANPWQLFAQRRIIVVPNTNLFLISLAASLTASGAIVRRLTRQKSASLTPSGTITRGATRPLTAVVAATGVKLKQLRRGLSAGVAANGAVQWQAARSLAASLTMSGTVSSSRVLLRALSASLAPSATLIGRATKALGASVTTVGTMSRAVVRLVAAAVPVAGAVARRLSRSLTASVAPAGAVRRTIARALAASLSPLASLLSALAGRGPGRIHASLIWTARLVTALSVRARISADLTATPRVQADLTTRPE